ncbi:hypothetical protein B0H16DRAFT_1734720 [Mycena metata]|uniref:CCHC-type domain-containing protein n=1 Tax=Mycena metata TaxID=1033252 RepID=A0AAD7HU44_9AGAR|nr:hypothetical protein B0H16DRAFT_1734720 [Mycena metata]
MLPLRALSTRISNPSLWARSPQPMHPIRASSSAPPSRGINGGEEGHLPTDCPRPVTCLLCSQEGHTSHECPQPRKLRTRKVRRFRACGSGLSSSEEGGLQKMWRNRACVAGLSTAELPKVLQVRLPRPFCWPVPEGVPKFPAEYDLFLSADVNPPWFTPNSFISITATRCPAWHSPAWHIENLRHNITANLWYQDCDYILVSSAAPALGPRPPFFLAFRTLSSRMTAALGPGHVAAHCENVKVRAYIARDNTSTRRRERSFIAFGH